MKKLYQVLTVLVIALMAFSVPFGGQTAFAAPGEPAAPAAPAKSSNNIYIVQMVDQPIVAYEGDIAGLKATAPRQGQKVNIFNKDVIAYGDYLKGRHNDALAAAGGGRKVYDYTFSYNGFAAELTQDQAAKIASAAGVLAVSPDELFTIDTSSTPAFLGLTDPGGLWEQLGGIGRGGEDVVIGIVDSGIWPESFSFSDRTGANGNGKKNDRLDYQQLPGWNARCIPGEEFNASNCNQKLISAQYFNASWGGNPGIEAQRPWEFTSPRDYNGHGTHTASTAGGNYGVPATGPASVFGTISGIAPRARISAYKALWSTQSGDTASGFTGDLVAAIDQAVADGVDVINYSISGSLTNFADPVMISYLFAARAGIFVSASAGNAGPTTATVAHPSPWVTTVAAGTHNRSGEGSVTLGNGVTYFGASLANAVGPAPLINASAAGFPGADPTMVALCYAADDNDGNPVLDPALVAGKIVVCDRGVTARVNKSLAVMEAGGVGVILINPAFSSLNADFHFLPTVHLQSTDFAAVHAYAETAGATATINQATVTYTTPAPLTASFSSRGPLRAGGGDLLKPDVIAPGQDILAAVAPPANAGRDFNLYSGTSMSAPHVAGLAALLKDLHPEWSPMMIKSAMMTSAYDVLDGPNTNPLVIFRQGAGHIRPNGAADPGLVFNSGWNDWLAFLCGSTSAVAPSSCSALAGLGYSFDVSDFNGASIAIGDLAGMQTVTRQVTNVGAAPATYTASVAGMVGVGVTVEPASLTLAPGETKSFTVSFTTLTATLNAYTGGQLTWTDGTHNVRLPLVVRPVALGVPAAVFGTGDPITYTVSFGYNGAFSATGRGLVPAALTEGSVSDDPTDSTCSLASPNAVLIPVVIPADTTYARFSLFDADVTPGTDIDLCVFRGTTLVGSSGTGTSAEEVNLLNPIAEAYTVVVQGWGVNGTSPFKLHTWLLGSSDAGNMAVTAPAAAQIGVPGEITLTFSGLAPATKYLGSVAYAGAAGMPNPTIVRVDMP
ncbi:MAG TPA: S8 family peptidase [Anaerolineales bacterium]|nr:S8 family peptidase [Anaerolineales bacterium]